MPHKGNFITDRIETILSLLDKSPGNVCHITPERDELLEHKYRSFDYHTTIDLLEQLMYLQDEDSILQYGCFQEELAQLKHIRTPASKDNFRLETIKQNLNNLIDKKIRTLFREIKNELALELHTEKTFLITSMEAELHLYQDLYALSNQDLDAFSNREKKDLKIIVDYSRYVKGLQWFAEQGSRKIYDNCEEVENDARFEDYCTKWKSELSFLDEININEINDDHKYTILQIGSEQASEKVRATQDSLIATTNKLLPQLQGYSFLKQSPYYIFGEVVQKHILLNTKIDQHSQKAFIFKQLLTCGLISTPNALITYLDRFPWKDEKDVEYFLSTIFTNNYLHLVGSVDEKRYPFSDEDITKDHSILIAIIEKIASVTEKDYSELLNRFVEHNPQYISLLTLQYKELLSTKPSASIQKKAHAVYSSLEKLYSEVSSYSNKERKQEQELVTSYFYYTNQLLLSKPHSSEREKLLIQYKQFALQAQGKPSLHWQLAGAAMLGLVACLLGLHIAIIASSVVGLVGLGIFATASIRTKESKAMLDFYNTMKA